MIGDANKSPRWTPRRLLRLVGIAAIALSLLMAVFGAYGLGTKVSARVFYIYWTVFFFFLMSAIALAVIDALVTMVKFRREHRDLKRKIGGAMRNDSGVNP